ncbi:IclR family transcriptional regulator [Halogeometricum sp. S1BR25-6]|uniref:IclR family transcriptional regulator n=1 Tax=Halogeometricum salsisoli TaxID=2950536 RepID=A0ABU2GIX8_9EURY|nr:IclR family transcriptional regulator [Halogeometricum sp. S1BR25-6]MDS0300760.1 IclR family transcriptional regulator [Halogeometricum sp. S1BR25-6]
MARTEIKSTATCFAIIEAVRTNGDAGISELARDVGVSKSGVYKHVQTLSRLGYLVRQGDRYHLSLRFLTLATRARERLPYDVAEPVVARLAETTGHAAHFSVRENDRVVYVCRADPSESAPAERTEGEIAPLHATSDGKAILANLDKETRGGILDRTGLPACTDKTITDRSALDRELQSIRDRRASFDREEYVRGCQSVASPVLRDDGTPVGAVSVAGDVQQMSGKRLEEDVVGLTISAAKRIEKEVRGPSSVS